jgi:hypothetical protein
LSNTIALPLQQPAISVHINLMEYRGVRYTIRIGITRGQWQVAIYLPDNELPKEKPVIGARQDAEITAHSIIDACDDKAIPRAPALIFCSPRRIAANIARPPELVGRRA